MGRGKLVADMTPEELAEHRAYRRNYMKQRRLKNPEKARAADKRSNARRKPRTGEQKRKANATSRAWHDKKSKDPEFRATKAKQAAERRAKVEADETPEEREARLEKKRFAERVRRVEGGGTVQAKERERYKRKMEDPERREEEKKRQREKEQKKRDAIYANPAHHEQYNEYIREYRRAKRMSENGPLLVDPQGLLPKCVTCNLYPRGIHDECQSCRKVKTRIRAQEEEVRLLLHTNGFIPSLENVTGPCNSESPRRADFVFGAHESAYTIVLEVDENYHRSYTPECETVRLQQLKEQYRNKPVFFVRYHPGRPRRGEHSGKIVSQSKKELLRCLRTVAALPAPGPNELPCGYNMVFIGYPEERIALLTSTRERMHHEAMALALKQVKRAEESAARQRRRLAAKNKVNEEQQ